ncbi:hypothetical protein BSK20_00740 [SR1 bacterium human oral taxon HOT-345]|nr:hypothetical protein BSK20_00740 [SR1 bacterium human oral taxon HOT-345]
MNIKTKRRPPEKKTLYEWIERLSFDEGEKFLVFCRKYYYLYPEYTVYRTKFEQLYRKFLRQKGQSCPLHPRYGINQKIRTIRGVRIFLLVQKLAK